MMQSGKRIVVGRIAGLYGVRGWVHIQSDTEPQDNILRYTPWQLGINGVWRTVRPLDGRPHGKGLVARIEGCDDRDQAQPLVGAEIAVPREALPALENEQYYWADLIGCQVVTTAGIELGHVDHLLETGANDVLVISGEQERLVPFIRDQVVTRVDMVARRIEVDWDPEF
ncbi:MAG: ribosome maturation factor RimM [Gammaproteobacteria bacterium]|nr:ribosome maturation factor RimM [Gammaproteobacteria bacterium]